MNSNQDFAGLAPKPGTSQPRAPVGSRTSYEVDSWDEVGIDEEARTLLLRGRASEERGDVEGALRSYDRVLAIPETQRHPTDTSETLHRSGVCASSLGDARRAWDAHLDAARALPGGEVAGNLADILSEAGLLRVTHPLALPEEAEVDEGLVAKAFDAAVEGARRYLLGDVPPTHAAAMRPHRAFTGLMVLAAHGGLDAELLRASEALFEDVARPLVERHGVRRRDPGDEASMVALAFEALARLCVTVAERERGRRQGEGLTRSEFASLTHHVGEAFVGGPLDLMAGWLGTYLRGRHGAEWVTGELVGSVGKP